MENNLPFRFPDLSVRQTQLLLSDVPELRISFAVSHKIRAAVLKKAAPKTLARNRIQKTLLPIAACLLAVVVFFVAFPKAALAVSEFIERIFTPSQYMSEDPASRTPIPSVDEALAAAAPKDGNYTITLMPDLPDAQEFVDFRAQNGYAPFSEESWSWLRNIRPEIAEVLYDGNQLIWNTNLYMTNTHVREFMECFGVESGSKLRVDALLDDATYTIEGDPTVYPLSSMGGGITPIFDEAELTNADHAVLYSDFAIDPATPLPDGVLTITQSIRVCENDAMTYGATVAIITHTFTFDSTKGNAPTAKGAEALIPLSGEVYLSILREETDSDGKLINWIIETKKTSLDGVKLKATYEYLATGIAVHLSVAEKPAGWTDDMTKSLMLPIDKSPNSNYINAGLSSELLIDGVPYSESSMPGSWTNGELTYTLPVFPNQYAALQSVLMRLTLYHYVALAGTNQLAGEPLYLPLDNDINLESDVQGTPLADITVPIPHN